MNWSWLLSLVYGLLSGITEFLPISSEAHQLVFLKLTGLQWQSQLGFRLFGHMGAFFAVFVMYRPYLKKLQRERRLSSVPARQRKRQINQKTVLEWRILKTAMIPVALSFVLPVLFPGQGVPLWILAIFMLLNGVLLYVPQYIPTGNKESQSMSAIDSILLGIAGIFGRIPGVSQLTTTAGTLKARGVQPQFALQLCMILYIPALLFGMVIDVYAMIVHSAAFSFAYFFKYLLSALASFGGAYASLYAMRFLSVKIGYSGFAYYSMGAALLTFIFYLLF